MIFVAIVTLLWAVSLARCMVKAMNTRPNHEDFNKLHALLAIHFIAIVPIGIVVEIIL